MADATYRGTRADFGRLMGALARALTGRGPDPLAAVGPILTRGAVVLLSKIQLAFIAKARGGVGDDGVKWKPLSPATIARRQTNKAELKRPGIGGGRGLGTLTDAQRKQWRQVYTKTLAGLRARGIKGAEPRAQAIAWGVLGRAGAKTKRQTLAGRSVEILRDTGALLQSLTPGYETSPARPLGQVFVAVPGIVTVGTNVKPWHHAGNKRLPARPLWPVGGNLPTAWWDAIAAGLARGIAVAVASASTRRAKA